MQLPGAHLKKSTTTGAGLGGDRRKSFGALERGSAAESWATLQLIETVEVKACVAKRAEGGKLVSELIMTVATAASFGRSSPILKMNRVQSLSLPLYKLAAPSKEAEEKKEAARR